MEEGGCSGEPRLRFNPIIWVTIRSYLVGFKQSCSSGNWTGGGVSVSTVGVLTGHSTGSESGVGG